MKVKGCYQFRLTRNADLSVDTEDVEDLAARCAASCSRVATGTRYAWRWWIPARRT